MNSGALVLHIIFTKVPISFRLKSGPPYIKIRIAYKQSR